MITATIDVNELKKLLHAVEEAEKILARLDTFRKFIGTNLEYDIPSVYCELVDARKKIESLITLENIDVNLS